MLLVSTRKALMFLRKANNVWDESMHPRGERGQFGSGGAGGAKLNEKGRRVLTGDQLRAALPEGTKTYEGVLLRRIKSVEYPDKAQFEATGLHCLISQYAAKPGGKPPRYPKYIYTTKHQQESADAKFAKADKLAKGGYGKVVGAYQKDLSSKDERTRACAAIVGLIDKTTMRVGGSGSEEDTGSVGATTMRAEHVTKVPGGLRFKFPGKSGKEWDRVVKDPAIVKAVSGFLAGKKPGDLVFPATAAHVNEFLDSKAGFKSTAKDFRTYHATAIADDKLKGEPAPKTEAEAKATVKRVVEETSEHLGNTPAVCKDRYIDPRVIDRYMARLKS